MRINILYNNDRIWNCWAKTLGYCLRKMGVDSDIFLLQGNNVTADNYNLDVDYCLILNKVPDNYNDIIPKGVKKIGFLAEPINFESNIEVIKENNKINMIKIENCDYLLIGTEMGREYLINKGNKNTCRI